MDAEHRSPGAALPTGRVPAEPAYLTPPGRDDVCCLDFEIILRFLTKTLPIPHDSPPRRLIRP